jgi:acetate kinase
VRVLVVNAGSSSLKLSVVVDGTVADATTIERWDGEGHLEPIQDFLHDLDAVDAVGHRVVHGGPRYRAAAAVDDDLLTYLASIEDLAPLHNPRAVAAMREVRGLVDAPAVACFDTAFHADLPEAARTYALPRGWNERWSLRRYGFHGLSHAYAVRRAAELLDRPLETLRIVSCHLGAGASLAAVVGGASVDTTMGFTPLEGLVMATRSGSVDPGLVLWLVQHGGVRVEELARVLEEESGLRGLAGSADLRDLVAARSAGDADASLAFDVFVHRLRREVGAMVASALGVDAVVLTGGIGEHSALVRSHLADGLAHLGVSVDARRNDDVEGDADVSAPGAPVRTLVVRAGEEIEIARQVHEVLSPTRFG